MPYNKQPTTNTKKKQQSKHQKYQPDGRPNGPSDAHDHQAEQEAEQAPVHHHHHQGHSLETSHCKAF